MRDDMDDKGWLPTDLARRSKLSDQTVSQFLQGKIQTSRTAKKLANALGYKTARRYLIRRETAVAS